MNPLYWLKRIIPRPVLELIRPPYHFVLAWFGALLYKHPSRGIKVIAVTGTKGKSTVVELITAILAANGNKVASLSTIQFRIDTDTHPNLYKMTTPGRFFVQRFLREAVDAGCEYAVLEMTSEGAKQFRHKFIEIDALVFTNLSPEHIESHGSFENYKNAKLSIAKAVESSPKQPRYLVANVDDEHGNDFLNFDVDRRLPYSLSDLKLHTLHKDGVSLVFEEVHDEITIRAPLVGLFNVYNVLAAITLTRELGVTFDVIERALRNLAPVRGRVERIKSPEGSSKHITAIVDYAHTPDSLEKLYEAFTDVPKIAVLGGTGGGRDSWKRPEMGAIAERHCRYVFLTNEDPYDEDPRSIVEDIAEGVEDKNKVEIIMDRRQAIAAALEIAEDGDYVIISGKGTDPYIMGPYGSKEPWSDSSVVRELMESMT